MLINPATIGRTTSVFVEISLTGQRDDQLDAFEAAISSCPGLMSCHLMTGDFDYLVHLMCADASEYEHIHRSHLARLPGVTRIKTSFALRPVLDRTAHLLASEASAGE
jgi:DNA-binding Lrp family transcriptional regulator